MSNFTGVTFAQQKVLPSDDAIIRRASLSDGVLYGCEMSYSGSTLTMGSGQLLICGRQIRHPAAENWAVVDATSGFARLVLTVDMTKTSSKDSFEQVVDSIEYAASQDGFPELVREDVNVSGTRYQVVACVVSLGTGGITGIVNQLGTVEGGGGGLNFKVVPGMTQPGTATEYTIWVKTERINNYYFSATQPENMADYDVWITTGTSSPVAFNALKKNGIQVYPLSAKQYISGALVNVTAKSWQGGEWVDWIPEGYLYYEGNQCVAFTGGWSTDGVSITSSDVVVPAILNDDHILIGQTTAASKNSYALVFTNNKVAIVSEAKTLYVDVTAIALPSGGEFNVTLQNTKVHNQSVVLTKAIKVQKNVRTTVPIDISGVSAECYISITAWYTSGSGYKAVKIHRVWVE